MDITDGAGVLRIPVIIPANTPEGAWPVVINVGNTAFSAANADEIPFSVLDGLIIIPEPASASVLGAFFAFGLCRRRHQG